MVTAGEWLRAGKCVAFPTETVFGLGANALDEAAVLKVFEHKGRPLTDPLIVHVLSTSEARALLKLDEGAAKLFDALAESFWPGPLTLVGPAADVIPGPVTAGTGFVGVRVPAHPVARSLLEAARVPVAAPSANRFGHVSPTSAAHVLADLGDRDIAVVDPGAGAGACRVGIESTVVGLDEGGASARVFRLGGAPLDGLAAAARSTGRDVAFKLVGRAEQSQGGAPAEADQGAGAPAPEASTEAPAEGLEAPGQLLTHYAPDVPAALCAWVRGDAAAAAGGRLVPLSGCAAPAAPLASTVVLDLAGHVGASGAVVSGALAYRCLDDASVDWAAAPEAAKAPAAAADAESPPAAAAPGRAGEASDGATAGAVDAARRAVFASLRWAEGVPGARAVLLCDPLAVPGWRDVAGADALRDRLFRAASGGFAGLRLE